MLYLCILGLDQTLWCLTLLWRAGLIGVFQRFPQIKSRTSVRRGPHAGAAPWHLRWMLIGVRVERECVFMSVEFETGAIHLNTFIINYSGCACLCTYNCLHEKEQRVHSALFCSIFLYHLHPHIIYICVSISSVCVALFCFSFSLLLSRFPSALRLIGYSWETVVKERERQTLKAALGRRRLTLWLKFASKATVVRVSII